MRLYTIYDRAAEEAGPVFQAKNDSVARRAYMQTVGDLSFNHDFDLYYIGDYNEHVMKITMLGDPIRVETENIIMEVINE